MPSALNPASRWHRSFNLGFPNAFDRAHNRTGSFVMVHGGCGSIGCFAMTDPVVDEIWRLVTAALKAGQPRFHVHVFPFRMTEENLASREHQPWVAVLAHPQAGVRRLPDGQAAAAHCRLRGHLQLRPGCAAERRQPRDRKGLPKLNGRHGLSWTRRDLMAEGLPKLCSS